MLANLIVDKAGPTFASRLTASLGCDAAALATAFETARRVIWENAAPAGITARDIDSIEEEMERVLAVIARAEDAGFSVNVSYVS